MTPLKLCRILVHVNPRSESHPALAVAMSLAKSHQASLTLIDVVPDFSWPMQLLTGGWEQTIEEIAGTKRKSLEELAASLAERGIETDHVMSNGRLSVAIIRQVLAGQYDLVMKVAERPAANRSGFLGSTDLRLLRKCPCPVLILKSDTEVGFQRVAAAVDVMDEGKTQRDLDRRVLEAATAFRHGPLDVVYAIQPVHEVIQLEPRGSEFVSDQQLAKWDDELESVARARLKSTVESLASTDVEYHLLRGSPAAEIAEFVSARGSDLLVMGTVARSGVDGLLIGNTAESILDQVSCSVLALKPAGFVSPIS